MVALFVLQGPDKGRQYDLPNNEPVVLGRASDIAPLTDVTVSRRHAHLEKRADGWYLRDDRSANGVFINGVRVTEDAKVKVGDQIRMGETLMVFGSPTRTVNLADITTPSGNPDDSAIISTAPSNDDSVILAAPEPSAAAMAHFRVLLKLTTAIANIFDREQLLSTVMDLVFKQLGADRGFIGLIDDAHKITPVVVRYREEQEAKISISQTIISHVLSKDEGVLSSNAMTDQRFSKGKSVHSLAIRSAICVPIKGREKTLGVIHIDTMVANYSYTMDQLRLLVAIGLQTGLALDNTRLYQQSVQRERLAATGQTVASLSHSVKNILQGMRGGADVVEIGLRKDSLVEVKKGWGILQRNLDKVQTLTMNMLAFSKPRVPSYELTSLPHVLQECLELVNKAAKDRKVTLLKEVDSGQPPVPIDADGIHQAVLNLLMNAIDACEPSRGVVTLNSHYDPVAQETTIEVQDNGMGIKPEDMEHIFQVFYSTKGQRGTGLGLAVTKKIIEEHGGTIQVLSKPDHGSTFRIRLPGSQQNMPDPGQTHGAK
jgi:signal transduction histidine kinase